VISADLKENVSEFINVFKMMFLCGLVYVSLRVPQNINIILQLSGAVFLMILTGLFPLVIFNKTMNHAGKHSCTRKLNYAIMASATVVGGLGIYQSVLDISKVTSH
jgi:hypothetical protein